MTARVEVYAITTLACVTVLWDGLVIDVSIKSSCFDGKAFGWLVDWLVGCLQRRGHHVTNLYNPRPIRSIIHSVRRKPPTSVYIILAVSLCVCLYLSLSYLTSPK